MTLVFASLYGIVVVSFLVPLALAFLHWRRNQTPLALKFIKTSLTFAAFVAALFLTYLLLEAWPSEADRIEVFFDSSYFGLYAALALVFSRLLSELLQRPWSGWRRRYAEGAALTGLVLLFLVHTLVFDNHERVAALRWVLNGFYLPSFLGWMLYLFVLGLLRAGTVVDAWKRRTLVGASWIFLATLPLFVIDALWPLFQVEWQVVPRGLNLHIAGVLVWNAFWAWRWLSFQPQPADPVAATVEPPALPDLPVLAALTARERDVARWVLAGGSNLEVATALGLGIGTVKNHLYHIFNKTGASSRKELKRMVEPS